MSSSTSVSAPVVSASVAPAINPGTPAVRGGTSRLPASRATRLVRGSLGGHGCRLLNGRERQDCQHPEQPREDPALRLPCSLSPDLKLPRPLVGRALPIMWRVMRSRNPPEARRVSNQGRDVRVWNEAVLPDGCPDRGFGSISALPVGGTGELDPLLQGDLRKFCMAARSRKKASGFGKANFHHPGFSPSTAIRRLSSGTQRCNRPSAHLSTGRWDSAKQAFPISNPASVRSAFVRAMDL